eukprot:scaffold129991_cov45-Phaeocystis_antarctica.AAC.1
MPGRCTLTPTPNPNPNPSPKHNPMPGSAYGAHDKSRLANIFFQATILLTAWTRASPPSAPRPPRCPRDRSSPPRSSSSCARAPPNP